MCIIGFHANANLFYRKYQATYPIHICDVSNTARDKNVDTVNIVSTSCGHVKSKNVAGATTTWSPILVAYLTTNMSFFLASFLLVSFAPRDCNLQRSPANMLCLHACPAIKGVVLVCSWGKHLNMLCFQK